MHEFNISFADYRYSLTSPTCSGGTTDSVDIIVRIPW